MELQSLEAQKSMCETQREQIKASLDTKRGDQGLIAQYKSKDTECQDIQRRVDQAYRDIYPR